MGKSELRERSYLTPNQVAEKLMVSPITVRGWALRGLLKAEVTPGGHRRFLIGEVERFARERQSHERNRAQRVLIVDENASLARYLQDLLSARGFHTETAFDGFEAGWRMHALQPDVLLLDLMMPHLNGYHVCQQVREHPDTRHVRVIAMTAFPSHSNETRILAEGAEQCLNKPIDEQALLDLLGTPMLGDLSS